MKKQKEEKKKVITARALDALNNKDTVVFSQPIKNRFPGFEKEWKKIVKKNGSELVDFLKEKVGDEVSFIKSLINFKLKLVVDNNFVLGQIMGAISMGKKMEDSFIFGLLDSGSVEIYAPCKLKEELHAKIQKLIKPENQDLAMQYAAALMEKMTIKDALWTEDWKKAKQLIGQTDPDDVPYLALAFDIGTHAIISFDKVFLKQGDFSVWQHSETDKMVTDYHSGFVSIYLMGNIGMLLANLVSIVFRFIRDTLIVLIDFLVKLASGIITTLSQLPLWVIGAFVAFGIVFWNDIKKMGKDFMMVAKQKAQEFIKKLKVAIGEITTLIGKVIDLAKLSGIITLEFLGFLLAEYAELSKQLNTINFE